MHDQDIFASLLLIIILVIVPSTFTLVLIPHRNLILSGSFVAALPPSHVACLKRINLIFGLLRNAVFTIPTTRSIARALNHRAIDVEELASHRDTSSLLLGSREGVLYLFTCFLWLLMRLDWLKQTLSTLTLAILIVHVLHGLMSWLLLLFFDKTIAVALVSFDLALGRLLLLFLYVVLPGLSNSSVSGSQHRVCLQLLLVQLFLLFIAFKLDVLFILDVQLAALKVGIAIVLIIVLVDLSMDHFLSLLVNLVLLDALVDLFDLLIDLLLVFFLVHTLDVGPWGVEDLRRFGLTGPFIAEVKVDKCAAYLYSSAHAWMDLKALLDHDESAKLTQVIQKQEVALE